MKKALLLILLGSIFYLAKSQTVWVPGGSSGIGNNTSTNNVGIGNSNPARLLTIGGSVQPVLGLKNTDALGWSTYINGNGNLSIYEYTNSDWTEGADRFAIKKGGNVGIGTTNPSYLFQIHNSNSPTIAIGEANQNTNGTSSLVFFAGKDASANAFTLRYFKDSSTDRIGFIDGSANERFTILNGGNVGIGTVSPAERLEIGGDANSNLKVGRWATLGITGSNLATIVGNNVKASQTTNNMEFITTTGDGGKAIKMHYLEGITFHTMYGNVTAGSAFSGYERMRITPDGQVGIGTTETGSHKLAVEGSIGAREIKVEASGWSDFVFDEDYTLRPLEEVETYIAENHHLPEIPSEVEVSENGINLGEMNAKLLQKIEELTLYLIEQNKQMIEQNKQLQAQKEEIEVLKQKIK